MKSASPTLMKNLLVLFMMLGAVHSFAADGGSMPVQNPPTQPKPKMVKVGDDYYLDFQDGRVAGFFQMIGKVLHSNLGLRQIENTCDFAQELTDCKLDMDIATRGFSLRWVKHPDAAKINAVVNSVSNDNGKRTLSPLEDTSTYFWYSTLKDSSFAAAFKPDRFSCNSFAWAKNIPVTNARINIDAWSAEFMFQSRETNVNENQTASTAFDVVLKTIDTKTFEFESIGQAKELVTALPPYFSSQVANLTFMDKNKQVCQVSFESSSDDLAKVARDPDFIKIDPQTQRPLRKAKDIMNSQLYFSISSALRPNVVTEFE